MRASSGCLTPDAYPLDANRAGLQGIYDYLKECELRLARPTVIEIRKSARSLKKFALHGRKGREEGTRELLHRRLPHLIPSAGQRTGTRLLSRRTASQNGNCLSLSLILTLDFHTDSELII